MHFIKTFASAALALSALSTAAPLPLHHGTGPKSIGSATLESIPNFPAQVMPPPALPPKAKRADNSSRAKSADDPLWARTAENSLWAKDAFNSLWAKRADNSLWAKRANSLWAKDTSALTSTSNMNLTSLLNFATPDPYAKVTQLHSDFSEPLARTIEGMHDDIVLLAQMDPESEEAKMLAKRLLAQAQELSKRKEIWTEDQDVPVQMIELLASRDAAEAAENGYEYAAGLNVLVRGPDAELLGRDELLTRKQLLARDVDANAKLLARDITTELLARGDLLEPIELDLPLTHTELLARYPEAAEILAHDIKAAKLLARDMKSEELAHAELLARGEDNGTKDPIDPKLCCLARDEAEGEDEMLA